MIRNLGAHNWQRNVKPPVEETFRQVKVYEDVTVEIIRPDDPIQVRDTNFTQADIDAMINLGVKTANNGRFTRA